MRGAARRLGVSALALLAACAGLSTGSAQAASTPYRTCANHVQALAKTTSCAFATSVFWTCNTGKSEQFAVYSPTTDRTYRVTCAGETNVTCTAGVGAEVRFSMSPTAVEQRRVAAATSPARCRQFYRQWHEGVYLGLLRYIKFRCDQP